jgi:hypothetical protein
MTLGVELGGPEDGQPNTGNGLGYFLLVVVMGKEQHIG